VRKQSIDEDDVEYIKGQRKNGKTPQVGVAWYAKVQTGLWGGETDLNGVLPLCSLQYKRSQVHSGTN